MSFLWALPIWAVAYLFGYIGTRCLQRFNHHHAAIDFVASLLCFSAATFMGTFGLAVFVG